MPYPRFETPVGAINGVNRDFRVVTDYKPGSVEVWINGNTPNRGNEDGWKEMGGPKVRLNEAPETGDVVQICYIPIA